MDNVDKLSLKEEVFNAISHGIGALMSISALVLLVVFSAIKGDAWHIVSTAIYGTTLIILYFSSTLYHAIQKKKAKSVFEIFDHASIYLLIAGTYTPFALVTLRGAVGWTIFGVIWALAVFGVLFKIFFIKKFNFLATIIYILMGWLIVFAFGPLMKNLNGNGLALLVWGGIAYTAGTFFYLYRKFKYHHLIWHFFVLAGSILHFFCIFFYVIPLAA